MGKYKLKPIATPQANSTVLGSSPVGKSENYSISGIADYIANEVDGVLQNNTIRVFFCIPRTSAGISGAAEALNNTSFLNVSDSENVVISVPTAYTKAVDNTTTYFESRDLYWLKKGKGTYGINGDNVISSSDLEYRRTVQVLSVETISNLPPIVYELSYQNIDATTVSSQVNIGASFFIDSNADYFFRVREFETGTGGYPIGTGNVQYYRFVGADGTYGLGLDQSIPADFVLLSQNDIDNNPSTLLGLPDVLDSTYENKNGWAWTAYENLSTEPPTRGTRLLNLNGYSKVSGVTIGGITAGDTVGPTISQVLDQLLAAPLTLPTSTPNSLSVTGFTAQTLEVGTLFSDTLVANYNRGVIQSKDGSPDIPLTGAVTTETFSGTGIGAATGVISTRVLLGVGNQWDLDIDYAAGTGDYYDSLGNVATNLDGLRVAGSLSQSSPIIKGLYKYWIFKGAVSTSPTSSAGVRVLAENGFSEPKTFDTVITAGTGEISIYLPQGTMILSILYVESSLANVTADFDANIMTVNDAEGVAVNYTRYTQNIGLVGYPSDATYRITLIDAV